MEMINGRGRWDTVFPFFFQLSAVLELLSLLLRGKVTIFFFFFFSESVVSKICITRSTNRYRDILKYVSFLNFQFVRRIDFT